MPFSFALNIDVSIKGITDAGYINPILKEQIALSKIHSDIKKEHDVKLKALSKQTKGITKSSSDQIKVIIKADSESSLDRISGLVNSKGGITKAKYKIGDSVSAALTYDELKKWVDYAIQNEAVIIFDGAYEAFITTKNTPHSIYEIEGAKKCAIEIRSFSKKAGFTGLRCSYTVIPSVLKVQKTPIKEYWIRRCETKFGGVPYPVQMGALAIYSKEGKQSIHKLLLEYIDQMKTLTEGLRSLGLTFYGGLDAPYVFVKSPSTSWEFFDELLTKAKIISIPGAGFGRCGEGYVRLSAFAPKEHIEIALNRLKEIYTCVTR